MYSQTLPDLIEGPLIRHETSELLALLEKQPELMAVRDQHNRTILMIAAYYRNAELVQRLLEQGVDLWDDENKFKHTALQHAFMMYEGKVAALLYYYEKQIKGNPMEGRNDDAYTNVFLASPDLKFISEVEHAAQIRVFTATMDKLYHSGAKLPEATHRIALERIEKRNRDARSSSDSSGGSGASGGGSRGSAGSELYHRRGGGDGSPGRSVDEGEKESAPLLAETAFRAAAEGAGTLTDKKPDSMRL